MFGVPFHDFIFFIFCSIGKLSKLEVLNLENNKLITLPERFVAGLRVIQVLPHTFFYISDIHA